MKVLAIVCLLALATSGFAEEAVETQGWGKNKVKTAWDIIIANPDLTTLRAAIEANNLQAALNDPKNPVTVWAPTNAALAAVVAALPAGTTLTNPVITQILLTHVARGKIFSLWRKGSRNITTLNGQITRIGRPPKTKKDASAQTVVITWNIQNSWRDGQNRIVNTSRVTTAKDGVVYIANGVLLPRNAFPNIAALTTFYNYTTVRDLVVSAGLLTTVDSPTTPKTVFGPTNQAFANIADIVGGLTPAQVSAVLTYHVSLGTLYTTAWKTQTIPTALPDSPLELVNPNRIQAAASAAITVLNNIYFPGGIFQGIDTVLIPAL